MPIYTYRCTNPDCLNEFDVMHERNHGLPVRCEACEYPAKKLMSPVPFRFKSKPIDIIQSGSGRKDTLT